MENSYRDVASFFSINQSRFPSYVIGTVIKSMEKLPNEMIMIFANSFHFKNPFLMLVLSIFWGILGIDRFLLNQKGKASFSLLLTMSFIFINIYQKILYQMVGLPPISDYVYWMLFVTILLLIIFFWFIDMFSIINDTRTDNWHILQCNLLGYFDVFNGAYDEENLSEDTNNYFREMILFSKINKNNNGKDSQKLKEEYDEKLKKQKTELETVIENLKKENEAMRKTVIAEIVQNMRDKGFNDEAINDVLGNKFDLL